MITDRNKVKQIISITLMSVLFINFVPTNVKPSNAESSPPPEVNVTVEVGGPDYTPLLEEQIELLEQIELNTRRKDLKYTASALVPINNTRSDYLPNNNTLLKSLGQRRKALDIWELQDDTKQVKKFIDTSESPAHLSNLNYLIENDVIHRDKGITAKIIRPGVYSLSIEKDLKYFNDPNNKFLKSEAHMALSKIYEGVQNSRAFYFSNNNVLRDLGKGYEVIDKLKGINAEDYKHKSLIEKADIGTSNVRITYPYGDTLIYIFPNVYELYFKKSIEKGILAIEDFMEGHQVYKDMDEYFNSNRKARWDNTLKTLDVSQIPVAAGGYSKEDSFNYPNYYQYSAVRDSRPLGSGYYHIVEGANFARLEPQNIESKHTNVFTDISISKQNIEFFPVEEMTLANFYEIIYKYMNAYERTLTQTEMDFIKFAFGANYTAPERYHVVLDYLIATGIINPEDVNETNNIHRILLMDEALEILRRVHNKDYRYTFKEVQLSATDTYFRDLGYQKNTISVENIRRRVGIETLTQDELDKIQVDIDEKYNVNYTIMIPKRESYRGSPPISQINSWYMTVQDLFDINFGQAGVDYISIYDEDDEYEIMYFKLTEEYHEYLLSLLEEESDTTKKLEINSGTSTDVPQLIGYLDKGPNTYYVVDVIEDTYGDIWKLSLNPDGDEEDVEEEGETSTAMLNVVEMVKYTLSNFKALITHPLNLIKNTVVKVIPSRAYAESDPEDDDQDDSDLEDGDDADDDPEITKEEIKVSDFTQREYEIESFLVATKEDDLKYYYYKPLKVTMDKVHNNPSDYPEITLTQVLLDDGRLGYNLKQKINANDHFEASNIARKNLDIKSMSGSYKMMGYTKDGTTLVHEKELVHFGIVQLYDKLLQNTNTNTTLLIPGTSSNVMVGSQIIVLPDGTNRADIDQDQVFYNLDAISSIMSYEDIAHVYNNSTVVTSIESTHHKDEEIIPIYNVDGEVIDNTRTINYKGKTLYSVTDLSTASNALLISEISKKFHILVTFQFEADTNISDKFTEEYSIDQYSDQLANFLFNPPNDPDLNEKHTMWREKINLIIKEYIPDFHTDNYFIKPKVTIIAEREDGEINNINRAHEYVDAIFDKSIDIIPKDAVRVDSDIILGETDRAYVLPNNNVFLGIEELPFLKKIGNKLVYSPTINFIEKANPLNEMDLNIGIKIDGESWRISDNLMDDEGVKWTVLDGIDNYTEMSYPISNNKVSDLFEFPLEELEGIAEFNIHTFTGDGIKIPTEIRDSVFYFNGEYYRFKSEFLVDNPDRGLFFSELLNPSNHETVTPEEDDSIIVYSTLNVKHNTTIVDEETRELSKESTIPFIDVSRFSMSILHNVIVGVDKKSHTELKVGDEVYFGALKATKINQPNKFATTLAISGSISEQEDVNLDMLIKIKNKAMNILRDTLLFYPIEKVSNIGLSREYEKHDDKKILHLRRSNFSVNNTNLNYQSNNNWTHSRIAFELEGDLIVAPLPSKGPNSYIAYGVEGLGLGSNAYTYDTMEGEPLNFVRRGLRYMFDKGQNLLDSLFKSINRGILLDNIRDNEYRTVIMYLKMIVLGILFYLWAITFCIKAVQMTTRGRTLYTIRDLYGIDVVKYVSLFSWNLDSNFAMHNVLFRMFTVFLVAAIVLKI